MMIVNITNDANDTSSVAIFPGASTKLQFGPAWVWIGATAAVLFVIVCLMWVISRQFRGEDEDDTTTRTYHRLGQPTIGANFHQPLVNDKAPGLAAGMVYNFYPIKSADHYPEKVENKSLLANLEMYNV